MTSEYYGVLTMKILLINNNPLVSRMLALCTRDEDIVLDEVKSVDAVGEGRYDLLFVDDSSYVEQVDTLLEEGRIREKVFISYTADDAKGFDETIKKPFLPSQIIKVIESVDMTEIWDTNLKKHSIFPLAKDGQIEEQMEQPDIFPVPVDQDEMSEEVIEEKIEEEEVAVLQKEDKTEEWKLEDEEDETEVLDSDEIEKIKALLDMDEEEDLALGHLNEEDYEVRKVEVIKEQLIADGLEILGEEEIIDAVSVKHDEAPEDKRKKIKSKSKEEKKKKKKKKKAENKKKKYSKFSEDELGTIEDAVALALESLDPKKMKKLLKGKEIELNIKLEDND